MACIRVRSGLVFQDNDITPPEKQDLEAHGSNAKIFKKCLILNNQITGLNSCDKVRLQSKKRRQLPPAPPKPTKLTGFIKFQPALAFSIRSIAAWNALSILIFDVSSKCASSAGRNGLSFRAISRSSRFKMSANIPS